MRYHLLGAAIAAIALGNKFADNAAESALFGYTVGDSENCEFNFDPQHEDHTNYHNLCIGEECYDD